MTTEEQSETRLQNTKSFTGPQKVHALAARLTEYPESVCSKRQGTEGRRQGRVRGGAPGADAARVRAGSMPFLSQSPQGVAGTHKVTSHLHGNSKELVYPREV